jgi:hypothetical protein
MLADDFLYPRDMRARAMRNAARGFRAHPVLGLMLLVAVLVAAGATAVAFLIAAIFTLALLIVGLIVVSAVVAFVRPAMLEFTEYDLPANTEADSASLKAYLASVDEFARLAEQAIAAGSMKPWAGGSARSASSNATSLHGRAAALARHWRRSARFGPLTRELEQAAGILRRYISEIRQKPPGRLPTEVIGWYREELSHRRDTLLAHLRETDFRAASAKR